MKKTYKVLGMSCISCVQKIENQLNAVYGISTQINLQKQEVEISSSEEIDLDYLNKELEKVGNYILQDPDQPTETKYIAPQDRVSPSSVYYCPMECEGEKVYFVKGKRCPDCNMYLVPIEEQEQNRQKGTHLYKNEGTITNQELGQAYHNPNNEGKYYCPMFCEGDKLYDSNVGCPVCGMDLVIIPYTDGTKTEDTYTILRKKFIISLIFAIPVFILSMGKMWVDCGDLPMDTGWIELALTLPILFHTGWFIMKRGWVSLRTHHYNMFSLIFIGVLSAFLFSLIALIIPEVIPHEIAHNGEVSLYFESVCVILTLVIMGQMLEAKAHKKTGKAIEELINLTPQTAHLIINGIEKEVSINEIKVGDRLRVKAGEKIPVDGKIIEGSSSIDEAMITGEPMPITKNIGDYATAGTINGNGSFIIMAEKVGDQTLLSSIIRLVNEASRSKAPIQKLVDKVAKIFVPAVVLVSVITFFSWYFLAEEQNFVYALLNSISVLIVACPCALGLATPMSLMVGIGKGAKHGILIKNAEAIEQMQKTNVLILDKTGTLTEGKPSVDEIFSISNIQEEILSIAVALSSQSSHPLSQAIKDKRKEKNIITKEASSFENVSGKGICGHLGNDFVLFGNKAMLSHYQINIPNEIEENLKNEENKVRTLSFVAKNKEVLGYICFTDKIKTSAKKAIEHIQKENIEIIMLTGDNEQTAKSVAQQLGILTYQANCLPQDKMDVIKKLQQQGKMVAMAGDGINDAPALAQANIGIAMDNGSGAAIESAEITLLKGDILGISKAKNLSKSLLRNIKENLFFAFVYNVLGIPIAAGILYPFFGILLSPMIAATAMSFSSVSVILNSLRLNKVRL